MNTKISIRFLPITFFILASPLYADNAIDTLNRSAEDLVRSLGLLGLILTGAAIGAGELLQNAFIQDIVHRYKKGVSAVVGLFAVCYALNDWVVKIGEWLAHPFTGN